MKAPNKIYIQTRTEPYCSITWSEVKEKNATNEEYIRKDALIEWLKERKNIVKRFGKRYNEANYYNSGCHDTIQELIDHLNEL
jgi:phage head maturation protease